MAGRQRRAAAPTIDVLIDRQRVTHEPDNDDSDIVDSDSDEEDVVEEIMDVENEVEEEIGAVDEQEIYVGRNGTRWESTVPDGRGRRGRQDIVRQAAGPTIATRHAESITDTFHLFVTDEILDIIVRHTNSYAAAFNEQNPEAWMTERWSPIDVSELKAFIACLLFAGVMKSRHESYEQLWSTDIGRPFLRACMSLCRFQMILKFIRCDDRARRAERRLTDKMAAAREIWELFLQRCRVCFNPGFNCTIDEQLVGFRGQCPFRVYMSSKPDRYGIKIWWICDTTTGYAYNGQVYLGRQGHLPEVGLSSRVVHDLSRPLANSGRHITMDNFFSSIPLAQSLFDQRLTVLGTLRSNKSDIPPQFQKNRNRELYSSLFGFNGQKTLCSYVPKVGKSVILLSTLHHDAELSEREDRKPTMIMDYNASKGAVDTLDQCVHAYSCSRGTSRWPNKILFNIIDVSCYNSFVIFIAKTPEWNQNKLTRRRLYLLELAKQLASPHLDRRAQNVRLPVPLRNLLADQGFQNRELPANAAAAAADDNQDRSRCYMCHQRKLVRVRCSTCKHFICKDHSIKTVICTNCNN